MIKKSPAKHSKLAVTVCAIALTGLGACQSTPGSGPAAGLKGFDHRNSASSAGGYSDRAMQILKNDYKQDPSDPKAALAFAKALRFTDSPRKALIILQGFVENPDVAGDNYSAILTEKAKSHLGLGSFRRAESLAQRAVDTQDQEAAQAYHILGIALDAQGKHEMAENAFRKGLEKWSGDPVPIMNNLALSLAAQDYSEEAIAILKKAQETDPGRRKIERNLRIVRALNETVSYDIPAPRPSRKPGSRDSK